MTTADWVIDLALILVVFRQLRAERLTARTVLLPLGIVAYVADSYLHGIPAAGNDLALVAAFTGVGAAFGLFGGLLTRVRSAGGAVYVKATWAAAALWVTSMSFRMAFAVWSSHRSGMLDLGRFSAAHHITGGEAWVAALVLMALSEVVVRLGVIVARGRLVAAGRGRTGAVVADPARPDVYA